MMPMRVGEERSVQTDMRSWRRGVVEDIVT